MQVRYLTNPTVHLLRAIEAYGGEIVNYHDSPKETNVITKVPDEWVERKRPHAVRFAIPTTDGWMYVRELKGFPKRFPPVTVLEEIT